MCLETVSTRDRANRTQVALVGDLKPGTCYRTPEGSTLMVTDQHAPDGSAAGTVVNMADGHVFTVSGDTKLAQDRLGRLYASRFLNQTTPAAKTPLEECCESLGIDPPNAILDHNPSGTEY